MCIGPMVQSVWAQALIARVLVSVRVADLSLGLLQILTPAHSVTETCIHKGEVLRLETHVSAYGA